MARIILQDRWVQASGNLPNLQSNTNAVNGNCSQPVYPIRKTGCEGFSYLALRVLDLNHFKDFGGFVILWRPSIQETQNSLTCAESSMMCVCVVYYLFSYIYIYFFSSSFLFVSFFFVFFFNCSLVFFCILKKIVFR